MTPIFKRAAALAASAATLQAAPAFADHGAAGTGPATSGPLVGASARTVGSGKVALELGVAIAEPDNRSDATLAALAGQHIHAHDQDSGQVYTLSAAYGLTDDLTLALSLPYVRRVAIREGDHSHAAGVVTNSVVARGDSAGIGDVAVTAKWRFTGENHHGWEAALIAGLKLPTGATHEIDDLGERFETEHQPGTGSWDPIAGIALTRPLPSGGFHASAVYQLSTRGAQDARLGDRAQAAIGLVHRVAGATLDYHAHEHHDAAEAHRHDGATLDAVVELNAEWEGREREGGVLDRESGGKALFVSPGLRLGVGRWSFSLGASLPLAQDIRLSHSDTSYRLRFGLGTAF